MYKRVAGVENEKQLGDVAGELEDRYGEPPLPVRNLLEYASLRLLSQRIGVASIERRRDLVSVKFTEKADVDLGRLAQFVAKNKGAQFTPQGILKFQLQSARPEEVLAGLKQILEQIAAEAVTSPVQ
jgi:transcription-repair coupling factor (superfamily II helicase)